LVCLNKLHLNKKRFRRLFKIKLADAYFKKLF
jgi:hypothetical protein